MIGNFFSPQKKKDNETTLFCPKIDLHSHLIPGIDDGSKSLEESIEMLRAMQALGYEKVITTPHVMADAYQNSTRTILRGLHKLREAAILEGIEIKIEAAAEYYLDEELISRLERGDILTIANEYLLFETSYFSKPLNFEEVIFEMQAKGYKALLAHPERYRYISDPGVEFERMKELGVYFQLDINSLGGYYGKQAKENARLLSEWGMIDFLGSDVHHKKQVRFLKKVFADQRYLALLRNNQILNETL